MQNGGRGGADLGRPLLRAAAAASSGLLCGLAFPLVGWTPLVWVGLVPLLLASRRARARHLPLLAASYALALWAVVWDWGPGAVTGYFGQPAAIGAAFFIGLALFTIAPQVGLALWAHAALARRFSIALPWLTAAAWAASELLRGRLLPIPFPFGNPWAILGYSQADVTLVAQLASLTGVYGISFVIVAVNAAFAETVDSARRGRGARHPLAAAASGAFALLAALAYGHANVGPEASPGAAPGARVGLVQPNLDPASHWSPSQYGRNLDRYLEQTVELARRERLDLVLWPESAMTFFLEDEPAYQRAIASHLTPFDLQLVAGAPRVAGEAFLNSLYLIEPDGAVAARYDKRVLIPLAEYVPLPGLDLLRRSFGQIRAYRPGAPSAPLPTRAGAAGVLICNESMFHELAAERVREGATLLINAAHDGWIPAAEYAEQQLQLARLRAIEQRRFLLRISTSGPSAIVDPWGRVLARTDPFSEASLVGTVHPRDDLTPYARIGDAFPILCGAVTLLALWAPARRED